MRGNEIVNERREILDALKRAAKKARELSRRTKTPFIVFKDGKIVDLNAKQSGVEQRKCKK